SGKRWDLDRRRDGLFILPPKNMTLATEDMLTFQRMNEHIEYFKRSSQTFVILTQANLVWNIDFNKVIAAHVSSEADITEVMGENTRLKTFVIKKDLLLEYIFDYDALPYKTLNDVVHHAPTVNVNPYVHHGYVRHVTDVYQYYKANLDMLHFDIGKTIFDEDRPILSKEKTAPPAHYLAHADIHNSLISSGSFIDGTVRNSIIGRDVTIEAGAMIDQCLIMSNAHVEAGAQLKHVILDKGTRVKAETIVEGTSSEPYVSQKEQTLTEIGEIRVLQVASEAYPFMKTGGLADVIGGLSRNLLKLGISAAVILPLYAQIKKNYADVLKKVASKVIQFGGEAHKIRLYEHHYRQVDVYFIEDYKYFEREAIYGYEDDCDRFAFFNLAVVSFLEELGRIDVIHLHDWHTALLPIIMHNHAKTQIKTVLTLHNIDYQGTCDASLIARLGIDAFIYRDTHINCLEIGINTADKLTTVSPTYRDELRYEYYGKNLTPALLKRERDFYGILNGLASHHDPAVDSVIISRYDINNMSAKTDNKLFLQKTMGLPLGLDKFIIGSVSRITEQKGFELSIAVLDRLLEEHDAIQFVLLGTGDETLIKQLQNLKKRYPAQVALNIGYDATEPSYIYAGADLFLMPSRVEPCGLAQMIAFRYGTLPLVRRTGGLADTVNDFDPITEKGNGFSFYNYDASGLKQRLEEAFTLFKQKPDVWQTLMRRGMQTDFSLIRQASKMLEVYRLLLES
ncbi:MAG: glycosyltransferase, partial [Acholeplasmatales bacterium]